MITQIYRQAFVPICVGVFAGSLLYPVKEKIAKSLHQLFDQNVRENVKADQTFAQTKKVDVLRSVVIVPLFEEFLFRYSVEHLISEEFSPSSASITTSLLFGLNHFGKLNGRSVVHSVTATVGGLTYSFLNSQFGLCAAIAAHATNNYLANRIKVRSS